MATNTQRNAVGAKIHYGFWLTVCCLPRYHFPYNLNYDIEQCNVLDVALIWRCLCVSIVCSTAWLDIFIQAVLSPLRSFYPIKFISSNIWIWHQRHIVRTERFTFLSFGCGSRFFLLQRHLFLAMAMFCIIFIEKRVFPFELLMFAALHHVIFVIFFSLLQSVYCFVRR